MHQIVSFRIFIGLLAYAAGASFSIAASTATDFEKNYNLLSHTYIHDVLSSISPLHSRASTLPFGLSDCIKELQIHHDYEGSVVNMNMLLPYPFMMVRLATKNVVNWDWNIHDDDFLENFKASIIFGHLYRYPFYFRIGWDHFPFGRHFSDVVIPYRVITRAGMNGLSLFGESGGSYKTVDYVLQGSMSVGMYEKQEGNVGPLFFGSLKGQYEYIQPLKMPYVTIERFLVGGGVGVADVGVTDEWDILLDYYSHINFSKFWNFLFEYVYNSRVLFVDIYDTEEEVASAHALHIEVSKYFTKMRINGWNTPLAIIGGYEWGPKLLQQKDLYCDPITIQTIQNFFFIGKVELWKQRIALLAGFKLNCKLKKPHPFLRASLSL